MPTYDYECQGCGNRFERFQSIRAASLRKCPRCGKHALQRLIGGGSGILFKGSGFYATDYRSESYRKAERAERNPAKEPEVKSPASTGTVPVASSDA